MRPVILIELIVGRRASFRAWINIGRKASSVVRNLPVTSATATSVRQVLLEHQLDISGSLLCVILIGVLIKNPFFERFVYIQGQLPNGNYIKHRHDTYFVLFGFVFITFARTFLMDKVFVPFLKYRKVRSPVILTKFKEQSVLAVYYLTSFLFGLYLYYYSPYWLSTEALWANYPHIEYLAGIKRYYLFQMSYWLQQLYYLQLEVRRKDYVYMCIHHVLTNWLIIVSYYCNFTRMGHLLLTLMDFSDIFLSFAKVLNYLKYSTTCDIFFGLFFLSWVPSRHVGLNWVIYSVYTHPLVYNEKPVWDPENEFYFSEAMRYAFLVVLGGLQVLMIVWFYMILKVVLRIVKGGNAADVRSSGEESEDDAPVPKKVQ